MKSRHGDDVARFDEWSATYDRSLMQRLFFEPVQRAVLAAASDAVAATILDVGCGTGRLLRAARARWADARAIGIDAAPGMLREASQWLPDALLLLARAERIPLADASVDLCFSTISMHHWEDKSAGAAEIARILTPGGTFVLADVSAGKWLSAISHERPYWRARDRQRAFAAAGMRVVSQRPLRGRAVLVTTAVRER